MKLSTILANYDEFQSSYKKIGFAQPTINIRDKRQFRLLLEKVISDIVIFNDILNIYDYSSQDKKQILSWLNKLGYKRETFIQLMIQKNIDNLYEDESLLEDDYNDVELFESEIEDQIEDMTFFTESEIEDQIKGMTFLMEAKKDSINDCTFEIADYFSTFDKNITKSFNLKKFADLEEIPYEKLTIMLCNLEDEKVMSDIGKGNYNTFDAFDSTQFNDDYEEMLSDLGMSEDEDDEDEDEDYSLNESVIEGMVFLNESKKPTLKENTIQIEEYFDGYGIVISDKFNLKKFANSEGFDQNTLAVLICNLEDEKVMKDIAKGNYNTFDAFDSTQFNDDYEDMMSDLGMSEDDDDEDDED